MENRSAVIDECTLDAVGAAINFGPQWRRPVARLSRYGLAEYRNDLLKITPLGRKELRRLWSER